MGKVCPDVFRYLNRTFDAAATSTSLQQRLLGFTTPTRPFAEFISESLREAKAESGLVEAGVRAAAAWPLHQAAAIQASSYIGLVSGIPVHFVAGKFEGMPKTQIAITVEAISIECSGSV